MYHDLYEAARRLAGPLYCDLASSFHLGYNRARFKRRYIVPGST